MSSQTTTSDQNYNLENVRAFSKEFILFQKHHPIPQSSFEKQRFLPFSCPVTLREYRVKPSLLEQQKDIDSFILEARQDVDFFYKYTFLREYNDMTFSKIVKLEKAYRKRWNKIKDKKVRNNEKRTDINYRCMLFRQLLKYYKRLFHAKYLRNLFDL